MTRPRGRPLQPRSDTERLDLLTELMAFGRARKNISIDWPPVAGIHLSVCTPGDFYDELASGDDLRQLLDRAISQKVARVRRIRAQGKRRRREKDARKAKP